MRFGRRGDELARDEGRDDDREPPPVAYQAVPFRPTRTAMSDELGRSLVKAGVALLPGLAFGATFALVATKALNAVRDFVRVRRTGTEPAIEVRVFNPRRGDRHVVDAEAEAEDPEPEPVPRSRASSSPTPKERRLEAGNAGKAKEGLAPPPPAPRPLGTATRRSRYLRRRAGGA